jgi:hypothetical protein
LNVRASRIDALQFENGVNPFCHSMQAYIPHGLYDHDRFPVAVSWLNSSYSVGEGNEICEDYQGAVAQLQGYFCQSIERANAEGSLSTELPAQRRTNFRTNFAPNIRSRTSKAD